MTIALALRAAPLAVAALLALALPARAVTIEEVKSEKGITAWLVEDHSVPVVSMSAAFRGGTAVDPADKRGLATMTVDLLDEGAGDLDSTAYQSQLEDLAAQLNFNAGPDTISVRLRALKSKLAPSFDLLRLALTQPRFDPEPVARVRASILDAIAREQHSPNALASRLWWKAAFPDHPYGLSSRGTVESVNSITPDDLRSLVHNRFAKDMLIVGIVGDITPAELKPLLDSTFGALPDHAAPGAVPDVKAQTKSEVEIANMPVPQSVLVFGEPGIKRDDPDWYAATIDNYILGGGGFGSRLMREIREKRGLAYGVNTYLVPQLLSGVIYGTVATQNDRVAESIALIRQEWQRMRDDGPTAQELADAKTYLTGSFALQFDSTGHIAGILLQLQQDNLGIDYLERRNALIEGVTLEDAKRVARRLYDPAALAFAVVGMPAELTPTREVSAGEN
jgi:zinc protease